MDVVSLSLLKSHDGECSIESLTRNLLALSLLPSRENPVQARTFSSSWRTRLGCAVSQADR